MALQEYVPTPWVNGTAPAINSTNLTKIENGIKEATDEINAIEDGSVSVGHALVADSLSGSITVPGTTPIGSMVVWPHETAPLNWEVCRGQDMSTSTYAALYTLIGSTFGSTSPGVFSLPDTRGLFVRGFDATNVNDPEVGRAFGSAQTDELKDHQHDYQNWAFVGDGAYDTGGARNGALTPDVTGLTGGAETRPKNIALTYIIRVL